MFGFVYRGIQIGSTFGAERPGPAQGLSGGRGKEVVIGNRPLLASLPYSSNRYINWFSLVGFRAVALRTTSRQVRQHRRAAFVQAERAVSSRQTGGGTNELAGLLEAIADEVRRHAGAIEDAITADFANRMLDARRRMPKHELASTLAALQQARRAALAAAARNAATELQGRRNAIGRSRSIGRAHSSLERSTYQERVSGSKPNLLG